MKEIEERPKQKEVTKISMTEQSDPHKVRSLLLPFTGPKGTTIVRNLKKTPKNVLPNNVKTRITYTG